MTTTVWPASVLAPRLDALPDRPVILINGTHFAQRQVAGAHTEWAGFDAVLADTTQELAERLEYAGWDFTTVYTPEGGFAFTAEAGDQNGESL